MPRISGVDIPADKPIWISLSYIYGVGRTNSKVILKEAGIDLQRRAKELSEDELAKIIGIIDRGVLVEGALRRQVNQQLSGLPPPPRPAGSRAAHPLQRPRPQRAAQDGGGEEGREGTREVRRTR